LNFLEEKMKSMSFLLTLLLLTASVWAQELEMRLVINKASGMPSQVIVSGNMDHEGWMGISFYPYATQNVLNDGEHQVLHLPKGEFEYRFDVGSRYAGGGVECALWEKRVMASQCPGPCEWCGHNGYHLENRIAYLYGSLALAEKGK
jgi:hypothetical protein